MAKDPVCGMEVDEKEAAAMFQHQGKTHVFCAPPCKATFEKAPEKYVGTGKAGKTGVRPSLSPGDPRGRWSETDRHLRRAVAAIVLVVLAGVLAGCPKRPATTAVAASAPSAPAPVPTTPAPVPSPRTVQPAVPVAPVSPAPAPARPPVPKEFAALEALRDIHFDFDKFEIRPGDAKVLDENARWMKANTNHLVLIEGHADERGTSEYNLALGQRRAKSTLNYLAAQGVQVDRITLISYGEERPQCTEHNETCWTRNRRVHFLVKAQ